MSEREDRSRHAGELGATGAVFVAVLVLAKPIWSWTVPELFPGAVAQGLVAATLSWGAAFEIGFAAAVVMFAALHGRRRTRADRDLRHAAARAQQEA